MILKKTNFHLHLYVALIGTKQLEVFIFIYFFIVVDRAIKKKLQDITITNAIHHY